MKTSAFIAILLAAVTTLSATDFSFPENATAHAATATRHGLLDASVLVDGTWTFATGGASKTVEFTENGHAAVFSKDDQGYLAYEAFTWRMEHAGGAAYLILSETCGQARSLRAERNGNGILLTDQGSSEKLFLALAPAAEAPGLSRLRSLLAGDWTNVNVFEKGQCHHRKGAFLSYQFRPDGRYTCSYGNKKKMNDEKGTWELSKDGQFLLLRTGTGQDCGTKVIRIDRVNDHELILQQVMRTSDIAEFFCTDLKTLAFIK